MKESNQNHPDSPNYHKQASLKWEALNEGKSLPQDPEVLQQMLREAQIKQFELELQQEDLLKEQAFDTLPDSLGLLLESEAKFRALAEHSPNNILILDKEFRIQYINRTVPDLTIDEVLGLSAIDFIPPDYQDIASESYKKCFETGQIGFFCDQICQPRWPENFLF